MALLGGRSAAGSSMPGARICTGEGTGSRNTNKGLFYDRTSTLGRRGNQLRLWFLSMDCVLLSELRWVLHGPSSSMTLWEDRAGTNT